MKLQVMIFAFIAMATLTALYVGDELPLFDEVLSFPAVPQQCPVEGVDADGCVYDPDFVAVTGLDSAQELGHNISEFFLWFIDLIIEWLVFIGQVGGYLAIVLAFIFTTLAYPLVLFTTSAPWWLTMLTMVPLSIIFGIKLYQALMPGKDGDA